MSISGVNIGVPSSVYESNMQHIGGTTQSVNKRDLEPAESHNQADAVILSGSKTDEAQDSFANASHIGLLGNSAREDDKEIDGQKSKGKAELSGKSMPLDLDESTGNDLMPLSMPLDLDESTGNDLMPLSMPLDLDESTGNDLMPLSMPLDLDESTGNDLMPLSLGKGSAAVSAQSMPLDLDESTDNDLMPLSMPLDLDESTGNDLMPLSLGNNSNPSTIWLPVPVGNTMPVPVEKGELVPVGDGGQVPPENGTAGDVAEPIPFWPPVPVGTTTPVVVDNGGDADFPDDIPTNGSGNIPGDVGGSDDTGKPGNVNNGPSIEDQQKEMQKAMEEQQAWEKFYTEMQAQQEKHFQELIKIMQELQDFMFQCFQEMAAKQAIAGHRWADEWDRVIRGDR